MPPAAPIASLPLLLQRCANCGCGDYGGDDVPEADGLKITEAAKRLGVGVTKMRQLVDQGVVKSWRMPNSTHRRVSPTDLERLRAEMLGEAPPAPEPPKPTVGHAEPPAQA